MFRFRRKQEPEGLGIFFCSDLHGSSTCFRKFINAAAYYRERGYPIRCLILGGDVTGKLIVPVIRERSGYRSYLLGKQVELTTEAELATFCKQCDTMGVYPHVFTPDEYAVFQDDPAVQKEIFDRLMLQRLAEWVDFADRKLAEQDVVCFVSPGNDDIPEVDDLLNSAQRIVNPDGRVVRVDDEWEMLSLGVSNITPFDCPRDVPETEITTRIDAMVREVADLEHCIFNLHVPPYNTGIDLAPKLDEQLRPQIGPQGVEMAPVGSEAVREAILRYQPPVSLHGHIHESKGTATLGRTLCINPGSEYSEGILRGALLTLRGTQVASHLLVSG